MRMFGTFDAPSKFGTISTNDTTIKFSPVIGTDIVVKNGVSQTINTRHQSISVMKEYEEKMFEELKFEDYFAKHNDGQHNAVNSGMFGSSNTLFNSTSSTDVFGGTSTTPKLGAFGNNDTHNVFGTQNSIFGNSPQSIETFGAQTYTQSFPTNTFQPSNFGSNTVQTSKSFGGFDQTNQNNPFSQNIPTFGFASNKPTTDFGFGTTNSSTSANRPFNSNPNSSGFQITSQAFGTNNGFEAMSIEQPNLLLIYNASNVLLLKFEYSRRT